MFNFRNIFLRIVSFKMIKRQVWCMTSFLISQKNAKSQSIIFKFKKNALRLCSLRAKIFPDLKNLFRKVFILISPQIRRRGSCVSNYIQQNGICLTSFRESGRSIINVKFIQVDIKKLRVFV